MDNVAKGVLGTIVVLINLILGPIWYGYVLSIVWVWFMVPVFNLPVLTKAAAIGIAITINFITNQDQKECKEEEKEFTEKIATTLVRVFFIPAFTLLYAYIIKQWM